MKKVLMLGLLSLAFLSCTENQMARKYGGTEEVKLAANHVFINATWKNDEMWIVTKDTTTNTYYFKEKSNFGFLEGTVIFK